MRRIACPPNPNTNPDPGFGGQAYIPTMLEKIKKIRKWGVDGGYDFDIEVDGGVKADWTIAQVRARF